MLNEQALRSIMYVTVEDWPRLSIEPRMVIATHLWQPSNMARRSTLVATGVYVCIAPGTCNDAHSAFSEDPKQWKLQKSEMFEVR